MGSAIERLKKRIASADNTSTSSSSISRLKNRIGDPSRLTAQLDDMIRSGQVSTQKLIAPKTTTTTNQTVFQKSGLNLDPLGAVQSGNNVGSWLSQKNADTFSRLKAVDYTTTDLSTTNARNEQFALKNNTTPKSETKAKYTYESVQDRLDNYETDFNNIVKSYGATQDADGSWTFRTQQGLDAVNALQKEFDEALADYDGYYGTAEYQAKVMQDLQSAYDKAKKNEAEAWEAYSEYTNSTHYSKVDQDTLDQLAATIAIAQKTREEAETKLETLKYGEEYVEKYGVGSKLQDVDRAVLGTGKDILSSVGVWGEHIKTAFQNVKDNNATHTAEDDEIAALTEELSQINNGTAIYTDEGKARAAEIEARLEELFELTKGASVDMNSKAMQKKEVAQSLREDAISNIESETGKLLANTAMSIGQNLAFAPLAAIPVVGPGLALAGMSGVAAADKMYEVSASGGSAGEALGRGVVAGGIEALTEKIPLDNLVDMVKAGGNGFIKNFLKQAGLEATEEGLSYTMNYIADKLAKDPNAVWDGKEFKESIISGGLSGMFFATGGTALHNVAFNTVNRAVDATISAVDATISPLVDATAIGERLQVAGGQEQVRLARTFADESDKTTIRRLNAFEAELEKGGSVDALTLGKIAQENDAKVQELVQRAQQYDTPEVATALGKLVMQKATSGYYTEAVVADLIAATTEAAKSGSVAVQTASAALRVQGAVTQAANPEANVLDAATTLYVQQGMRLNKATAKATTVQKLIAGKKVSEDDIDNLALHDKKNQQIFTQLTGVEFPSGVKLSPERIRNIARSAHTVAQQQKEARVQQVQAEQAIQAQQAQVAKGSANTPNSFSDFVEAAQQQFPDASQEQLTKAYNQYMNGTKTVTFAGRNLTRDQFIQMMRSAPNGQDASQDMLDGMFNRAIVDTMKGTDAFERFALVQKQQAQKRMASEAGDAALRASQDALAQRWANILKKFGVREVVFSDTMRANENASYENGVVKFNRNLITDERALVWTMGHELVHSIPETDNQRKNFVNDIIKTFEAIGELKNTKREIDKLRKVYEKHHGKSLSDDFIREELAADLMRKAFLNYDMMVKLGATKPSLLYRAKRILERLKGESNDIKEVREAVENLQDRLLNAIRVTEAKASYKSGHTVTNDKGDPVAQSDKDGSIKSSLRTFDEEGRQVLSDWLDVAVEKNDLTQDEADDILRVMDDIYQVCQEIREDYAPFDNWSKAKVVTDSEGHPVFSVVKPNNDYVMNLDFSTVCKKRRTLDAVLNELVARGDIEKIQFDKQGTNFVRINDIIREHGFETACALCFVDSKRFRQANVADTFVNMWNGMVKSIAPKGATIAHFNFGNNGLIDGSAVGIDEMDDLNLSALDKVMKKNGDGTVPYAIAKHLKENPQDRKLLMRGDFLSSEGFTTVSTEKPEILKLFNRKKGSGGPKSTFPDVQYLNEVIRSKSFNAKKAYAVGGVRVQSFSDYVPRMVFDYVQMFADLAAKKLPAHAYTKEELFVKQFGLTGIKINMSLIPAVVEGGVAPGLDADGNYVWADESFDYEEAKRIQNAEGYSRNCGTICVGISDEHIRQLLADDTIRMVIPYHKSGLNHIIAAMNNVAKFTDYTKSQNTRHKDGTKLTKAEANEVPNFNERLHELGAEGDPRAVAEEYVRWCEEHNYLPKFDQFVYQQIDGVFVEENGKKVVDPNYYKLLQDFTVYDDGAYVPQEGVTMTFPTEDSAFGSMTELIKRGLKEDAILEGKRDAEVGTIADEIEQEMVPEKRLSLAYEHADNPVMADFLNVAKEMYANNESAEDIFDKTSWRRSAVDGRWRFEIDDSKMHWKVNPRKLWGQTVRLGDAIEHTLLFQNYPSLASVNVTFDLPSTGATTGMFDPDTSTIHLKKNHTNTLKNRRTLIHEIQHAIQSYEFKVNYSNGVALADNVQTGFNPDAGYEVVFAKAYVRVKGDPEFQALSTYENRVRYVEHEIAETERRRNPKGNRSDAYYINRALSDVYENALGEVEAEEAANRLEYDDNWRNAHAPDSINSNKAIGSKMLERSRDLYEIAHKEMGWNGVDDKAGLIYNSSRKRGVSNAEESADYGENRTGSVGRTFGGTETLSDSGSGRQSKQVSQSSFKRTLVQENLQNEINSKASDESGAFSLPEKRFSISRAQDKAYAEAVENGDILTAQRMVDEAAKAAGYVQAVFHGTDEEFNRFDRNIAKQKAAEHRWLASYPAGTIFLAGKRSTASGYGSRRMDLYLDITGMKTFKHKDMYAADAMDELHTGDISKYPVIAVEGSDDTIYATLSGARVKRTDAAIYDDNGDLIPLSKRFNHGSTDTRYSLSDGEYADTFYSKLERVVDEMKMPRLGAANGVDYLKGRGVKDEEIKWSGIEEFLKGKKSVSKEELQEFVRNSQLQIVEETLDYNTEYPLSEDDRALIAAYNENHYEAMDDLVEEWERIVGSEAPFTRESNIDSTRIFNMTYELAQNRVSKTPEGKRFAEMRISIMGMIRLNDDFGYDYTADAYRDLVADPDGFIQNFEMDAESEALIRDYAAAKKLADKVKQEVSPDVQDVQKLMDLADEATSWTKKANQIESAHHKKTLTHRPRWDNRRLRGGENYREYLFKLSGSEYTNHSMELHWKENAQGVLAHARVQDFDTANGKMLFIEEIQSDWHNAGRKKGYETGEMASLIEKRTALMKQLQSISDDDVETKRDLNRQYDAVARRIHDLGNDRGNKVPDAPFKNNYHEYVLKSLLRKAAEGGYDSIGWTTAEIQDKRWADGHQHKEGEGKSGFLKGYQIEYDQKIRGFLKDFGKKWGATVGQTMLDKRDAELLEALESARAREASDEFDTMDIDDIIALQSSIEQMEEELAKRKEETVWYMPITEEMKNSVLYEGQAKFSLSDDDYMAAVESGDLETAQRMVDEAAKAAGYKETVYHGTDADFTVFKRGELGIHIGTIEQANDRLKSTRRKGRVMNLYAKLGNSFEIYRDYGDWHGKNTAQMLLETEEVEALANYDESKYEEIESKLNEIARMPDSTYTDTVLREYLQSLGWDSITYENRFEDAADWEGDNWSHIVFDPQDVKSADPVTYDDNGNVIPLSQRFNSENKDIRYSLSGSESNDVDAIIARIYNHETVNLDKAVVDWNLEWFEQQWNKGYYSSVVDSIAEHTGKSKQDVWNAFAPVLLKTEGIAKMDGKTYINVHELNEDNLRKAFELGGLASPSIGIVDVDSPATHFGDIALIFPNIFDPSTNPTYYGDSYSSSFPAVGRFTDSIILEDALTYGFDGMEWGGILSPEEISNLVYELEQVYFYDARQRTSHSISKDGFADAQEFAQNYNIKSIPELQKLFDGLSAQYDSYEAFLKDFADKVFTNQRMHRTYTGGSDFDFDARRYHFKDYNLENVVDEMTSQGDNDFNMALGERATDYDELLSPGMRARLKSGSQRLYEVKPQRAVYFDEISYAVVPEDTGSDIIEMLEYNGVKVVKYQRKEGYMGIADGRAEAIKGILESDTTGIRYSLGYHAGDLGKAEFYHQQGYSRGTGHFGTGTYFVGDEAQINRGEYGKRPHHSVEFDNYNLYKVYNDKNGYELHNLLKVLDGGFTQEFLDAAMSDKFRVSDLRQTAWNRAEGYDAEKWDDDLGMFIHTDYIGANIRAFTEVANENGIEIQNYDEWLAEQSPDDVPEQGESDYDLYKYDYLDYLKETVESVDSEKNDGYDKFRDTYFGLWLRFGKDETNQALQKVVEHQLSINPDGERNFHREEAKHADSNATVFMKALGYEGIDTRGTGLDNVGYGSVIYDLKGEDLARKQEIGTARFSLSDSEGNELSKGQVDYFRNSQARDADGALQAYYHGTGYAGFTEFDPSRGRYGGNWFTTSRIDADDYAGNYEHKLFDPNERNSSRSVASGDFRIGSEMRFDTEEDRTQFLKDNPGAENYHTNAELDALMKQASEADDWDTYDALEEEKFSRGRKAIERAYARYEWEHAQIKTIGEMLDNPNGYSMSDVLRAWDAFDRNNTAYDSVLDGATVEDLIEGLRSAVEEEEGVRDVTFRARVQAGQTGDEVRTVNNRTYAVYLNMVNPVIIDAHGSTMMQNNLYARVQAAMEQSDNDGVIIRNVRVGAHEKLGDVAITKASNQEKLTTNLNPTDDPDIRYSITPDFEEWYLSQFPADQQEHARANLEGARRWEQLQAQTKEGNFHPEGANGVRETRVPKTDFDENPISKSVATVMGAKAIPDDVVVQLQSMAANGDFSYGYKSDQSAIQKARLTIHQKGFDGAMELFRSEVTAGRMSKDIAVLGQVLLNNAANNRDGKVIAELMCLYQTLNTNAGQTLQAMSIFRKLNPESQLYGVRKIVDSLNDEIQKKHGKKSARQKAKENNPYNIPVEEWMQKTGELLAESLVKRAQSSAPKAKTTAEIILEDLKRVAFESVKTAPKTQTKRSDLEIIEDLFWNQAEFQKAWDAAKATVEKQYGDNPAVMEALEAWRESALDYQSLFSEKFAGEYGVQIDPKLVDKFLSQSTQEGRDAVMEEIYKNIASQVPSTWVDKLNAWRYLAMLGNLRTHVRNVVGNAFFQPIVMSKNVVATLMEAAVYHTGGKKRGMERTKAFTLDPVLYKMAWNDFSDVKEALAGNKYNDAQSKIMDMRTIFKFKPLEAVRKFNSNALSTEDAIFKRVTYATALSGYLRAHGVTGANANEIDADLLSKARDYAGHEALKATFNDDNALSNLVGKARFRKVKGDDGKARAANMLAGAGNVVIEGALPFKKTPANILVRALEYSPVGLGKGLTYDLFQVARGNKTGAEAIDGIAAGLSGTALAVLGAVLAAMGRVTGGAGDDKDDEWDEQLGHQGYALELDDGTSITLDWMAPEALPFFMGVEAMNAFGESGATASDIEDALKALANPLLEMSMLQSLNDMLDNVSYSDSKLGAIITSCLTSYFTQFVPTLGGQIERTGEDTRYMAYSDKTNKWIPTDMQYIASKVSAKVPGWDYQQVPYIDLWGQTESTGKAYERVLNNFANPAYISQVEMDDTESELQRLRESRGDSSLYPSKAERSIEYTVENEETGTKTAVKIDLTAEQYVTYATTLGQTRYSLLADGMDTDAYRNMTDADKAEYVKKVYTFANDVAKMAVSDYTTDDKWVTNTMNAQKDIGVSPAEYLSLYVAAGNLEGYKYTDRDGKQQTVDNSQALKVAVMVYDCGYDEETTDKLLEALGVSKTVRGWNPNLSRRKLEQMEKKYG